MGRADWPHALTSPIITSIGFHLAGTGWGMGALTRIVLTVCMRATIVAAVTSVAQASTRHKVPLHDAVAQLSVTDEHSRLGFSRHRFRHWIYSDGDGCATRKRAELRLMQHSTPGWYGLRGVGAVSAATVAAREVLWSRKGAAPGSRLSSGFVCDRHVRACRGLGGEDGMLDGFRSGNRHRPANGSAAGPHPALTPPTRYLTCPASAPMATGTRNAHDGNADRAHTPWSSTSWSTATVRTCWASARTAAR